MRSTRISFPHSGGSKIIFSTSCSPHDRAAITTRDADFTLFIKVSVFHETLGGGV